MKTQKILLVLALLILLFAICCRRVSTITTPIMLEENPSRTPLHIAVMKNDKERVQSLIDNGADINARDNIRGQTPLHIAALLSYRDMTKQLIDNGADTKIKDNDGRTPLDLTRLIEDLNEAP